MTKQPKLQLQFYNTKTRSVEVFQPHNPELVKIYSCGPTVYSYQHIGNLKAALSWDILRRVITYAGYNLYSVQNITDVGHLTDDDELGDDGDDKMMRAAKSEKKTPLEIAQFYTNVYLQDLEKLHIQLPSVMPKATEHIQEQLEMIEKLEVEGVTYTTSDGVYFDVSKYKDYGQLSGQKLDEKEVGVRIDVNSEKRNPQDFALWKFASGKHEHHAMKWDSKWGVGFPGWHIECSAMGYKYLGEYIDIHTGGIDHIPIHHENEIAQNACSHCIKDVTFWMHNGHITFAGEKMSKSLGNVYLISDLEEKGYSALSYRLLLLQSHYRKSGDISFEALDAAQQNLNKIHYFLYELQFKAFNDRENESLHKELEKNLREFNESICDDLNTAKALKNVYSIISFVNSLGSIHQDDIKKVYEYFYTIDRVLGLIDETKITSSIPQEIQELAQKRKSAKEEKNFSKADDIREKIEQQGFVIKDDKRFANGFIIYKKE